MNCIHPNDRVYALERALAAAVAQGEDRKVLGDLREILAEDRQDACTIEGTLFAARQPVAQTYSIDADPAGIRARVADVITGTLMVGAQGYTPPPPGHWAEPFWQMARADAAAQGIDLGQVREIRIPARNSLDPISVFVQDQAAGRGRIVVTCYGNAWQAFWGAMGNRTVMEFVAQCDADYVAGNMISGRQTRMTKAERAYTERITTEVIAEFRALLGQRDAAQGVGNG